MSDVDQPDTTFESPPTSWVEDLWVDNQNLKAENARLQEGVAQLGRMWEANQDLLAESKEIDFLFEHTARIKELEADNARLREEVDALENIVRFAFDFGDEMIDFKRLDAEFQEAIFSDLENLYSDAPLPGEGTP
jgi:hypothetical protein